MPGGVPDGGSWGRSWDHFGFQGRPRGVPGTPGDEKVSKMDLRTPPQGPSWEAKWRLFVNLVGLFSYRFFDYGFRGLQVQFEVDLGRLLEGF